jgi:hypothetical protein
VDLAGLSAHRPAGFGRQRSLQAGWHFGFNIPAFLVVMILTVILVRGIRESARTNNVMVLIKIAAILVFVFAAASFIKPHYWHPFMPNGWTGVLTGGSIIFFTYIGFDSVSTAAEECKNPQRDLPIGILATLVACTVLYGGVAHCAQRHCALAVGDGRRGAGGQRAQAALAASRRPQSYLGAALCAHRRAAGHDLLDPRLPAWPGARLVRHVARRLAADRSSAAFIPNSAPPP